MVSIKWMEHYKKTRSVYLEEPLRANELRVTGAGKVRDLATRASHLMKEHPGEGVHVSAVGTYVTKAVTVVELLKRKIQGLQVTTTIKYAKVEDFWEPDMEGLDSMQVTRKIPSISMYLLPEGTGKTTAAELAHAGATARPRPSSGSSAGGRTRGSGGRKRAKSGSSVGGGPTTKGAEKGAIGQLSDLKLETKDTAETAKKSCDSRGCGKSQQGGSREGREGQSGEQTLDSGRDT